MANLQLNIEVNDEDFKTLCTENINNLPKDKLEEILIKAVEVALIGEKENPSYNKEESFLVAKERSYYNSYKYVPSDLMKEIMKKVDLTPYINELAETIKNYIENNYQSIIKEYVVESFAKMIFSTDKAYELRNSLISDVNNILDNRG